MLILKVSLLELVFRLFLFLFFPQYSRSGEDFCWACENHVNRSLKSFDRSFEPPPHLSSWFVHGPLLYQKRNWSTAVMRYNAFTDKTMLMIYITFDACFWGMKSYTIWAYYRSHKWAWGRIGQNRPKRDKRKLPQKQNFLQIVLKYHIS